ncbi:hypothetical protein C8R44DRAFT_60406 [Mycena epipterygia]|nr:hypothetical protein C8R44DRAFT_60406 [Mycena epipterygia]
MSQRIILAVPLVLVSGCLPLACPNLDVSPLTFADLPSQKPDPSRSAGLNDSVVLPICSSLLVSFPEYFLDKLVEDERWTATVRDNRPPLLSVPQGTRHHSNPLERRHSVIAID